VTVLCLDAEGFVRLAQLVYLKFRQAFHVDYLILGFVYGVDKLIQLQMDRFRVPVLRVLNEKHHQKCNDRCPGIDDQLPGVRIMKNRTGKAPHDNDGDRDQKSPFRPKILRTAGGELTEPALP
jgi:hypothetical protein